MSEKSGKYVVICDILRMFALMGVLVCHLAMFLPLSPWIKLVSLSGMRGVQVFFVLSAYLACFTFIGQKLCIKSYYRRRCLRILPCYYFAIFLSILLVEGIGGGSSPDVFGLGWLRYFLGLNTILPSTDFSQWNNLFGFWCMPGFLFFYAIVPLLMYFIRSRRAAWIFFIACVGLAFGVAECGHRLEEVGSYEKMLMLARYSPWYQMQHFALGVLCFYTCREGGINATLVSFLLLLCVFLCISVKLEISGSLFAGIIILLFRNISMEVDGIWVKILRFISHYSFHIYLGHLPAFYIASFCMGYFSYTHSGAMYYCGYVAVVCVITAVIVFFMELVNRFVRRMVA